MPRNYRTEAKTQFPLPEYPQEGKFEDAVQYETAITQFRVDHAHVLVQHNEWVDCKQIMDITHASEATHCRCLIGLTLQSALADWWCLHWIPETCGSSSVS